MINFNRAALFYQDSVDKKVHIYYDDTGHIGPGLLYDGEFEITESLNSGKEVRFGTCESAILKFKISAAAEPLTGKRLTVMLEVDGNTDELLPLGVFTVKSDTPTADRSQRAVVAYDAMADILNAEAAGWYNAALPAADSQMTLREFRASFLEYFGIEQEEADLVNDDMVIKRTISPSSIRGSEIIRAICEINGVFGHINRAGKFVYLRLYKPAQGLFPSNTLYPRDDLYPAGNVAHRATWASYISATYEDYTVQRIDCLKIRQEEKDVGATVGTGSNVYVVQDNFMAYGKSAAELQAIAEALYPVMNEMEFVPTAIQATGNPCLEVGDIINLMTGTEVKTTYILTRTLKGVYSLSDSYKSQSSKTQTFNAGSVRSQYTQLRGKIASVKLTVDEISSEVKDIEDGSASIIQQLSNEINARVTANGGSTSFSWHLEADKFELKSNNNVVFKCDASGITVAGTASASALNAVSSRVGSLEADHVTTAQLNATNGKIDTLASKAITTDNLSAQTINGSQITAGTITAAKINVSDLATGFVNQVITCRGITSSGLIESTQGGVIGNYLKSYTGVEIHNNGSFSPHTHTFRVYNNDGSYSNLDITVLSTG